MERWTQRYGDSNNLYATLDDAWLSSKGIDRRKDLLHRYMNNILPGGERERERKQWTLKEQVRKITSINYSYTRSIVRLRIPHLHACNMVG